MHLIPVCRHLRVLEQTGVRVRNRDEFREVMNTGKLHASPALGVNDGPLCRPDAPQVTFLSAHADSLLSLPSVASKCPSLEHGERGKAILIPMSWFTSNRYRLYHMLTTLPRNGPMLRTNARSVILFAREDAWNFGEAHGILLDKANNAIMSCRGQESSGEWHLATRLKTDWGVHPLNVSIAVAESIDLSRADDDDWRVMDVARVEMQAVCLTLV